jgi:hypothetical protein
MSKVYEYHLDKQKSCQHINTEYIAPELDINVAENYFCNDCGMELRLPEPDDDL